MIGMHHRQVHDRQPGLRHDPVDRLGERIRIAAGDDEPQVQIVLALVVVRDQRLAADDPRHLLQPVRRDLHRRERAHADRVGPDHGADARDQVMLAHAAEDAERLLLTERGGAPDDLERLLHQREVVLPAIDQTEFDGARGHCPILVARAVKKMPEGFCAEISAFFAKEAAS